MVSSIYSIRIHWMVEANGWFKRNLQNWKSEDKKCHNGVSVPRPRNYLSVNYNSKHCLIQKIVCKIRVIQQSWQTKLSKVKCWSTFTENWNTFWSAQKISSLAWLLPESGVLSALGSRESVQTWENNCNLQKHFHQEKITRHSRWMSYFSEIGHG